ncbi:hypothetical protein Gpo141_00010936 [Globisporangium polare]
MDERSPARPQPQQQQPQRRWTSHGRGAGFTTDEVMDLLAIIKSQQPLRGEDWSVIAQQHNAVSTHPARTADSLRRKFASLCRLAPPGGNDRHWSREVREAVRVRKVIDQRAALADGDNGDEPLAGDAVRAAFENDEDDEEEEGDANTPAVSNSEALGDRGEGSDTTTDQADASETARSTAPASPPVVVSTRASRQRQRQSGRASIGSMSNASPSAALPPRVAYTPTQAPWTPQLPIGGPPVGATPMYPSAPVPPYQAAPWYNLPQAPQSHDEVLQLLKVQILTNQQEEQSRRAAEDRWRQEERERRAEEKREREKDRLEERKFREDMMHRHEQMMEAMLLLIAKQDK